MCSLDRYELSVCFLYPGEMIICLRCRVTVCAYKELYYKITTVGALNCCFNV